MSGARWWKCARRASEPDRWLDEMGLYRKHTARDASCLFRAVSENIYSTQRYFSNVRADCVQFMAANRNLFEGLMPCPIENYLKEMSNPSEWGGMNEIVAMSHVYRCNFVILSAEKDLTANRTDIHNGYTKDIYLFHIEDSKHFDAVYTKDHINASAYCQSLVYESLYDGVFELKDLSYAVEKMLHDKTDHIEYFMAENVERRKRMKDTNKDVPEKKLAKCNHQVDDVEKLSNFRSLNFFMLNKHLSQLENLCQTCLNLNSAKDLLDHGVTPFPYKVAKALDPDIYRNIEFDVWNEIRREIRYSSRYGDGHTLQVGVKCLCRLQADQIVPYHCHIQEMRTDQPCLVFVEELGEKMFVGYDQLEPLPLDQVRPWAPPYRRMHSQYLSLGLMLQQLGNINRKHSLNKMRYKSKTQCDDEKRSDKQSIQAKWSNTKLSWAEDDFNVVMDKKEYDDMICNDINCGQYMMNNIDLSAYHQLDYYNFQPYPVEVTALPLMVDLRPATGAPPQPPAADQPPTPALPSPADTQPAQQMPSGEMGGHQMAAPTTVRASTPASGVALNTYTGSMPSSYGACPVPPYMMYGGGVGGGAMKGGVVWCAPPPAPMQHMPPHNINLNVHKSMQSNGSDLPMNDITTMRYFYNLGIDCLWVHMSCAPPVMPPPLPPPHAPPPLTPHPPHRHYSPVNDLAQDMQQNLSLHDRPMSNHNGQGGHNGDHKGGKMGVGNMQDKSGGRDQKGNGQRPLVGPRFKRDNNQGNQNKPHNNMGNKGMNNNRRNSHMDNRGGGGYGGMGPGGAELDCGPVDPALLAMPYMPYPPPFYTHYYPVPADPGMLGMMGDGTYMPYMGEDLGEPYPAPVYYPQPPHYAPQLPPPPPPAHLQQQPHPDHK